MGWGWGGQLPDFRIGKAWGEALTIGPCDSCWDVAEALSALTRAKDGSRRRGFRPKGMVVIHIWRLLAPRLRG